MRRILVIGATSAIAQHAARYCAADGDRLYLVARAESKLSSVAEDLRVRGASQVNILAADLADFGQHDKIVSMAADSLSGLDTVLIAHGRLGDQKACEQSYSRAEEDLRINFLSTASLLTPIANLFERERRGCIAVISSVAGDRGRQSNYIYGTAKSALNTFLQGLRNRLYPFGVSVITIKPGFVDTPMTAHLQKNLLFASPEFVGRKIYEAVVCEQDCVYVPWFWRPIMWAIRSIPESLFKRLRL